MHVPHALATAGALACAVWLVYVADRLLDTRSEPAPWPSAPHAALSQMYREHAREFLLAGAAVALLTAVLLSALPRILVEAWLLLAVPLAMYAAAVHVLHLPARWKAVCVSVFFAVAVALPAAVHGSMGWPLLTAALAFGGVCRTNCAVLRAASRRLRIVLATSLAVALLPLLFVEARVIVPACAGALLLLWLLVRKRESASARLGWLSWRALVDAVLVAPALLVSVCVLIAR
ncbi:hypothetical protein [Terriglobus sp.]|uniref:hypothetical protein n=1 Tax=Terriglobus sp. TaxID=1889013 RepID=UPI003B00E104